MIAAAVLFGCSTPEGGTPPPQASTPSRTSIASPTPTPISSPTPTPIPQVLLIAQTPVAWEESLESLVSSSGWLLIVSDLPSASTYLQGSSAVIAIVSVQEALDGDLQQAAAEGIPVVMVDVRGVDPGPSLSTVGENGARHDQAGFLAGVMAGLASQSGSVGEVTATGGPQEAAYSAGFSQGLLWGCPQCELVSQPAAEMSPDGFRAKGVDVVFPIPGPAADEVAEVLGAGGLPMVWVGEGGPPGETRVGRVIFEADRLVIPALEALMETGEGEAWPYSIESHTILIVDINEDLLSPGRQRLLDEAYEAIAAGELDIGTDTEGPQGTSEGE